MKDVGIPPLRQQEIINKTITMAGAANYDVPLMKIGKLPTVEELELIQISIMVSMLNCEKRQEFEVKLEELRILKDAFNLNALEADNIDLANEIYQKRDQLITHIVHMEEEKPKVRSLFKGLWN